jgi:hypothetical protein
MRFRPARVDGAYLCRSIDAECGAPLGFVPAASVGRRRSHFAAEIQQFRAISFRGNIILNFL